MAGERVGELAIFSGECLLAVCGLPIGFRDMHGTELFTGDIVLIFTVRQCGDDPEALSYLPDHLTAVVSDEWATFNTGRDERDFIRKGGSPEFFVMGIKSVPLHEPGEWRVMRVKRWSDVIAGEHWTDYGFNYRTLPEQVRAAIAAATGDQS
jgi:hypothetical protein